jgi:hypothetical protein
MNNIPKENAISRVLPSDPLKKNTAHERTSSLLSAQQNAYKHQKSLHKRLIPSRLLHTLLAKLIATLHGNTPPFKKPSSNNHGRYSPAKKQKMNKQ